MADQLPKTPQPWDRRAFLTAALAAGAAIPGFAQQPAAPQIPPSQPRDWSGEGQPVRYPDPDIITLDPRFRRYIIGNTPIRRLHTGTLWAEGPAWNSVGRFLMWSDIPNNVQLRWIEEDNRVTVFRNPSGYSNGNTFDHQGRQLSCEHGNRRVVRYEHTGEVTVIAERYQGKRLNSPNDVAVHPDGTIFFTDPRYGIQGDYEGFRAESETKTAVYRVDPQNARIDLVADDIDMPNGICFSPDYKRLYVADTGSGRDISVFDVDGHVPRNKRRFVELQVPGGGRSVADGMRCDADGNVWAGANPGVQVIAPDGVQIGMIRLPENCSNVAFGGTRRNRLFMTASQSLYSVYVNVRGAGPA